MSVHNGMNAQNQLATDLNRLSMASYPHPDYNIYRHPFHDYPSSPYDILMEVSYIHNFSIPI